MAVVIVVVAVLAVVVLRTLSSSSPDRADHDARVVVVRPSTVLALPTGTDPRQQMAGFSPPTLESEFSPDFKVAGSAEASVYPAVGVEAGWRVRGLGKLAAAAKLGIRGGIHVGYALAEQRPMRTCVPVTIEASLTVHVVRKSLGPWTVTPYEKNLVCRPRDPLSEG